MDLDLFELGLMIFHKMSLGTLTICNKITGYLINVYRYDVPKVFTLLDSRALSRALATKEDGKDITQAAQARCCNLQMFRDLNKNRLTSLIISM